MRDGMFDCHDCGVNTWEIQEYYMIHNHLWEIHGVKIGMLCVGCLEERFGRQLRPTDFTLVPINWESHEWHSDRLASRIGDVPPPRPRRRSVPV